ncbi:aldehyde dehydrogenase domain-containing protein [Xylariaceae sp. FL0804]|nr:aldehyde dehydrogenase domain-containing protein [Xylariaceae sp. FL0804]
MSSPSDYTVPFFIDGADRAPATTHDVTSPSTGGVAHRCGVATEAEAAAAVDAASAALRTWRRSRPAARRDAILRAHDLLVSGERRERLDAHLRNETGADDFWVGLNMGLMTEVIRDVAGRVSGLVGSVPAVADPDVSAMVVKEPYGVVLSMAPWNAPLILGMRSILFPIAAGCTVVFKGSEASPGCHYELVSALHEAGIPKGVVNFITTDAAHAPAVTEYIIAHPQVKKLNFTGSTAVGSILAKLAGQYLKPCVMELGGKAPAIVWEDANLDLAAEQCVLGSFAFAGQVCMATERIVVHKKVSAAFQAKLAATLEAIHPATGEAPVLIAAQAAEKNKRLLRDATGKGAALLNGDIEAEESTRTRMRPIVVTRVTPDMDIYRLESFGPTVSLLEVETEEEALRIANDTEYGLSSAVFTEDLRVGLRFAQGIETGAVHINNMTIHDESVLPHGGVKSSGFGRFNAMEGLEEWVRTKTITWRN